MKFCVCTFPHIERCSQSHSAAPARERQRLHSAALEQRISAPNQCVKCIEINFRKCFSEALCFVLFVFLFASASPAPFHLFLSRAHSSASASLRPAAARMRNSIKINNNIP